jgi:hypothetical protein
MLVKMAKIVVNLTGKKLAVCMIAIYKNKAVKR